MGSYRRGKKECGDLDLLIVEPSYVKTTPRGALDELVTRLKACGHISHHLTNVEGASGRASSDSQSSYEDCAQDATVPPPPPDPVYGGKKSSQSYMGVFCSPTVTGRMRRIDIKWYPYRERIFAALYFTGNGWFNRSMRRWVKRENLSLNDHGLFDERKVMNDTKLRKSSNAPYFEAKTEREVFDRLGLVYKEPTDRNYFDDVMPKDTSVDWDPGAMTQHEWDADVRVHEELRATDGVVGVD